MGTHRSQGTSRDLRRVLLGVSSIGDARPVGNPVHCLLIAWGEPVEIPEKVGGKPVKKC